MILPHYAGGVSLRPRRGASQRGHSLSLIHIFVCEDEDKNVWLIDKHAAHERVNFDRMKANQEPLTSLSASSSSAGMASPLSISAGDVYKRQAVWRAAS